MSTAGARHERWKAFIAEETSHLDVQSCFIWLCHHCEDYIDRWSGFCVQTERPSPALFTGDLFVLIEVAADALVRHVRSSRASDDASAAAQSLADAVERIRAAEDITAGQELHRLLSIVRKEGASLG